MSYFKKSHQHKPKKGKGSYTRDAPSLQDMADMKRILEEAQVYPRYVIVYDDEMREFLMYELRNWIHKPNGRNQHAL